MWSQRWALIQYDWHPCNGGMGTQTRVQGQPYEDTGEDDVYTPRRDDWEGTGPTNCLILDLRPAQHCCWRCSVLGLCNGSQSRPAQPLSRSGFHLRAAEHRRWSESPSP